jgi:hypothetical protein
MEARRRAKATGVELVGNEKLGGSTQKVEWGRHGRL